MYSNSDISNGRKFLVEEYLVDCSIITFCGFFFGNFTDKTFGSYVLFSFAVDIWTDSSQNCQSTKINSQPNLRSYGTYVNGLYLYVYRYYT